MFILFSSMPAPGARAHGLAWDNGLLWCLESNDWAIYKLDPRDGNLLAKVQLAAADPEPHGMSMRHDAVWYCDATSRWDRRLVAS